MRVRRTFTNEFKREVVEAVTSGQVRQLEMSRKYGISPVLSPDGKGNTARASSLKTMILIPQDLRSS